jgi:hypothetical protein
MVELDDITYPREEYIAVIRDFYSLLTKFYFREPSVIEPPEGGWLSITAETIRCVGKSDEVAELLPLRLSYIENHRDTRIQAEETSGNEFADWQFDCRDVAFGRG